MDDRCEHCSLDRISRAFAPVQLKLWRRGVPGESSKFEMWDKLRMHDAGPGAVIAMPPVTLTDCSGGYEQVTRTPRLNDTC